MRLARIVDEVMNRFADRPAIAERQRLFRLDEAGSRTILEYDRHYVTTNYRDLWQRANRIAAGLQNAADLQLRDGDKLAFLAFTSGDYAALDLACIRLGVATIPLQTTSSDAELASILNETQPKALAVSSQYFPVATRLALDHGSIRRIIVFDSHKQVDDHREAFEVATEGLRRSDASSPLTTLTELFKIGSRADEAEWPLETEDDPLAMLIYTSGSTGSPKGAMYTERLAAGMWGGSWSQIFSDARPVSIHYMPMSHVAGHSSLKNTLARGGSCYFTAQSNLSSLLEDISMAKPTELSLVPRVCELLYQRFHTERVRRYSRGDDDARIDETVMTEMRMNLLGGRVQWASCSSAPLSGDLKSFIERLLAVDLHNVYGSTEAGAIWIDNKLLMPPVTDYKLVDVPELGYATTDLPHPRGELLLKTTSIIPGYYKRPDLARDLFDEDGFYRTGDIVAEVGPGELDFVDRRKNVIKLSQGEFVATAKLETAFAASPLIRNVFVHARSEWSGPLAVVVPTENLLTQFAGAEAELKRRISESLRAIGKAEQLRPFEIPRDIIIESTPFSQKNGLLSDHGKPMWPKLRARYGAELDSLYGGISARELRDLYDIYRNRQDRPVIETVRQAVWSVVGGSDLDVRASDRFRDLGGDSLSAVQLSLLLEEAFDRRVPIDLIISQGSDLQSLADYIERQDRETIERPSAASVHGAGASAYHAGQLSLETFVSQDVLDQAHTLAAPLTTPRVTLLTGASGFLGRFLCLESLLRAQEAGGKVICIVRGKDEASAYGRLAKTFGGPDGSLRADFRHASYQHLEVLAGDMSLPRLGLDDETWARLSSEVDAIVHAGALVNHVLPYGQFFEANVLGTSELIALALTSRMKAFTFISSIAVAAPEIGRPPVDEDIDIRLARRSMTDGDGYASGYATSKWAGEVLLREANEKFRLPVTVFRSSMILAHRTFAEQVNVPDSFTRLVISLLQTGVAPTSFYRADLEISPSNAHYDGLPVDFTAKAILELGSGHQDGHRTFNLVNPHDDGISLDTVVDWLSESGRPIERVSDYSRWLGDFERALRSLPESDRKNSVLPLLPSYAQPLDPVIGSSIPSSRFRQAVRSASTKLGEIPHLSSSLISKYVSDLEQLGLIPKIASAPRLEQVKCDRAFDVV